MIAAMIMARANRAAEAKAVAELAPFPKTGPRSHRHRQPHGPGALGQPERHETPDPRRSNAVEPRFHGARQRAERSGFPVSVRPATGRASRSALWAGTAKASGAIGAVGVTGRG
jgi:hypothetical protein